MHMHDFVSALSDALQVEFERRSVLRSIAEGTEIYRKNDRSVEMYRLVSGAVRLCNYSRDGSEIIAGEFRPGDCFGEMGLIDGLPRISHAVATKDSQIRVLSKSHFEELCAQHSEFSRELNRVLCSRLRLLYSLNEEASGLNLHQRLARIIQRLAYSHGQQQPDASITIDVSHEELSKMLGASRQSVSKELKALEREGDIELCYGKILIYDLNRIEQQYEQAIGMDQLASVYEIPDGG